MVAEVAIDLNFAAAIFELVAADYGLTSRHSRCHM